MKFKSKIQLFMLIVSLSACGGGGDDEAGAPTALSVQPKDLTVSAGATGPCYDGFVGEVFIYGGAAPYKIDNTFPDSIAFDKSVVNDRGASFKVYYINGNCFDPGVVVITDKLKQQTTLTLHNKLSTAKP
jgi:hypothetical protein